MHQLPSNLRLVKFRAEIRMICVIQLFCSPGQRAQRVPGGGERARDCRQNPCFDPGLHGGVGRHDGRGRPHFSIAPAAHPQRHLADKTIHTTPLFDLRLQTTIDISLLYLNKFI